MLSRVLSLNNVIFKIGKIDRNKLDFLNSGARPLPPTKPVMIWGGLEEEVFVYDDEAYLSELRVYNSVLYTKRRKLFLDAIEFDTDDISKIVDTELYTLTGDILVSSLTTQQIETLFDAVLYESTVTPEGMQKAYNMFSVEWKGELVHTIKVPSADITYTQLYRDMNVASNIGYTWRQFCELSGQEQSNQIAFNQIKNTLEYLERK